jgi:hypothetical protein
MAPSALASDAGRSARGGRLARFVSIAALGSLGAFLPSCRSSDDAYVPIGRLTASLDAGEDVKWLNVFSGVGSITLKPAPAEQISVRADVSVRASAREKFAAADLTRDLSLATSAGIATITNRHDQEGERSLFKIDFEIAAPARLQWTIMRAIGEVKVEAQDNSVVANVLVGTVEVTGAVRHLELVVAVGKARADLKSLGGGSIVVTTGDAKCTVRESGPTERLELITTTGDVELELPPTAANEIDLLSAMGGCDVSNAPNVKPVSAGLGRHAQGTVGAGGPRITANASVGNVRLSVRR